MKRMASADDIIELQKDRARLEFMLTIPACVVHYCDDDGDSMGFAFIPRYSEDRWQDRKYSKTAREAVDVAMNELNETRGKNGAEPL